MESLLHRIRATAPAWAALVLVAMIGIAVASLPALAGSTSSPKTAAEWGAAWLADQVSPEGWVISNKEVAGTIATALALAAVGVEGPVFDRAVDWVEDNFQTWTLDRAGALGQVVLLAVAAGKNPRNFGGMDLVTRIDLQRRPTGDDQGMYGLPNSAAAVFLHSFAILGLKAAGAPIPRESIDWLVQQQCPDGFWPTYRTPQERTAGTCSASAAESDASAVAVGALYAVGEPPRYDAAAGLLAFQGPGGGFVSHFAQTENSNSGGLVLQAIVAMGENPASGRWRQSDGDSALSAVLDLQFDCSSAPAARGGFRWTATSSGASLLATAQAVWGVSGRPFPYGNRRPPVIDAQVCVTASASASPSGSTTATPTETLSPSTSPSPTQSTEQGTGSAPAPSPTGRAVERISGTDRFSSSAAVARESFLPSVPVAFLATGAGFADTLAAGAAGMQLQGPVLLTTRDHLPDSVANELARLRPGRIIVLGGPAAVSDVVVQEAARYAPVERVNGPDRYETAGALSRRAFPEPIHRLLIATGEDFPDALAGIGAAPDGPLLLVGRDHLPKATESELHRLGPFEVFVLGGPNAVSDAVVQQIREVTGGVVERLSGSDRYETSVNATRAGTDTAKVVYVAAGDRFADALPGAAAAGVRETGILLVARDHVPAVVLAEIRRLDPDRIIILGGPNSVSPAVAQQLAAA